jgi:chemotaxis protein CheX
VSLQNAPTDLQLPAILDLSAAAPLAEKFLRLRGQPVTVDASQVERLGGLCLQLRLDVTGRSAAFDEALTLFAAPSFDACED